MNKPKKGEAVKVRHGIHWEKGIPILVGKRTVESNVDAVYEDERVRVTSGDVWFVKRINGILHTVAR